MFYSCDYALREIQNVGCIQEKNYWKNGKLNHVHEEYMGRVEHVCLGKRRIRGAFLDLLYNRKN